MGALSWESVKIQIESGQLPWDDIFGSIGDLDVMASSDVDGWDGAQAIISPELKEEPEPAIDLDAVKVSSFIAFLLLGWFKAAKAFFTAKIEKEKADAAAAEAEAAAAAAA